MKNTLAFLILAISSMNSSGVIIYKGSIGKQPIEFNVKIYADSTVRAIYQYVKYQQSIDLNGQMLHDTLKLKEGEDVTIFLYGYSIDKKNLKGVWSNHKTKKTFPITLSKTARISFYDNTEIQDIEILQSAKSKIYNFKATVSKEKDSDYPKVTGIRVHNTEFDSLDQLLDCEGTVDIIEDSSMFDIVEFEDYNGDGFEDFSVFEARYANGGTSRLYYIYNPETKLFYDAFSGTNLEFTGKNTAVSSNSCCGNSIQSSSEYRIENGDLILVFEKEITFDRETFEELEVHCFTFDEQAGERVEIECK